MSSRSKQILATNIKKYMDGRGLDRKQLATKLGVKYSTFCDWLQESHPSYPKIDYIQEIADILGVKTSYLIDENETEDIDYMVSKMLETKDFIPVLGKIPAGVPYEAIEESNPEDFEFIPRSWLTGNKKYFALKLDGDSMEPKYHDGDIAIFLKTPTCNSGENCCVRIGHDDATFKKVKILSNGILVSPLNPENSSGFSEKFYTAEDVQNMPVEIMGVLVDCRPAKVKRD